MNIYFKYAWSRSHQYDFLDHDLNPCSTYMLYSFYTIYMTTQNNKKAELLKLAEIRHLEVKKKHEGRRKHIMWFIWQYGKSYKYSKTNKI